MTTKKEKFVKDLKRFVTSGFKEVLFTKSLYQQLSFCFHHIAHYNKHGCYAVWFSSPEKQIRWLDHVTCIKTYGDPKFCYVDAEHEIQVWLLEHTEFLERAQDTSAPSREQRLEDGLRRIINLEYEDIHTAKEIARSVLAS